MGLLLPHSDIMLSATTEVAEICKPLKNLDISFFSHTRVYNDGTFIDISNSVEMIKKLYYETDLYKLYTPDVEPHLLGDGFFLCSELEDNLALKMLRDDLNIDNIIALIEQKTDHYEIWNFGSVREKANINNVYLKNLDVLKTFAYVFKDKGHSLIRAFEKDKITRDLPCNYKHKPLPSESKKQVLLNEMNNQMQRLYLERDYLTRREIDCLKWYALGKTAEETGIILSISKKTVETHINTIKTKLNCSNKAELVLKATHFGLA